MSDFRIGNGLNFSPYASSQVDMPSNVSNDPQAQAINGIDKSEKASKVECQTCKNRKYQDQSNDPGVSFKSPGNISPEESASKVMSHEQEHVTNEQANAKREGKEVVSQSVSLETSVCPECKKVYVSGGVTKTVVADKKSDDAFTDNYKKTMTENFGLFIDAKT